MHQLIAKTAATAAGLEGVPPGVITMTGRPTKGAALYYSNPAFWRGAAKTRRAIAAQTRDEGGNQYEVDRHLTVAGFYEAVGRLDYVPMPPPAELDDDSIVLEQKRVRRASPDQLSAPVTLAASLGVENLSILERIRLAFSFGSSKKAA